MRQKLACQPAVAAAARAKRLNINRDLEGIYRSRPIDPSITL